MSNRLVCDKCQDAIDRDDSPDYDYVVVTQMSNQEVMHSIDLCSWCSMGILTEVKEIPGFEGTRDQLEKLSIKREA